MSLRTESRAHLWAMLAILLVAGALRFWRLDQFPPGLSVDEAYNLLDAQAILDGGRPIFLPDNAGREALYSYWQAGLVALLGYGAFPLRVASALIGVLTVAVSVWCLSALPWPRARQTALVAAAILAGLFWHVLFSRFGIRAISMPLLAALMLGWLWRGMMTGQMKLFALAGVALGVAVYTGTAARVLPLAPVLSLGYLAWTDRTKARQTVLGLVLLLAVAGLVVLPLAVYFLQFPVQFSTHLNEVAVGPADLLANIPRVLAMFNLRGDAAWWRNLAGRPVFDPLMGIAFLVGLLVLLAGRPNPPLLRLEGQGEGFSTLAPILVLIWLGVMLIPTLAADAAPNFSRAIGILPVVCVIPARALVLGYDWLAARRRAWATPAMMGILLVSLAWTAWDYFGVFAGRPEPYYAYDAEKVAAGQALKAVASEGPVYAARGLADHATVRAVTRGVDVRAYDPSRGVVLADGPTTLFLWARDEPSMAASPPLLALNTLGAQRFLIPDDRGQPLLVGYRLLTPAPSDVRAMLGLRPGQVRFGEVIGLSGYRLLASPPAVVLMWNALAPLERDWTVFVHFDDAQGKTLAFADGDPLGGTYPTRRWQPGERILEWRAPKDLPPGVYRVRVGWYDRGSGARLPLPGVPDAAFDLGEATVP
ncbi:MAG: hypothetical protein KIT87_11240 [Anaerolineae bacterium]|nr:hypothetical protein [Anaerolineae bacterium]